MQNSPTNDAEIEIDTFLAQFRGKSVLYLPNPGNAGDSVIAAATYQCFHRNNISFVVAHPDHIEPHGKVIFYGGGGNLIGPETYASNQVRRLHRDAEQFIILPQTIKNVDDIISSFGENVTVICRERTSFNYVQSFRGKFTKLLGHDMAFSLDAQKLLSNKQDMLGVMSAYVKAVMRAQGRTKPANIMRLLLGMPRGALPERKKNGPVLRCFRLDGERTNISIPEDNYDLSAIVEFGVAPERVGTETARQLLSILNEFDEIHTNRLHLAISSAILGKRVKIYANNYYKVRAVYEYSIEKKFANVEWIE